jgi:hypothetical protein
MPEPLNLTIEKLERPGIFLLEDGQNIFLWIGREAPPQMLLDLLGVQSYDHIRGGKVSLYKPPNPRGAGLFCIILIPFRAVLPVDTSAARQPFFTARERANRQAARGKTRRLLSSILRCQGRWGPRTPAMVPVASYRGPHRYSDELPAMASAS